MFKEIKDSWGYEFAKTVGGAMANIGGGAIAGVAAAMVPTEKMNPIQKFCIGVGAYAIGRWVGTNAKAALKEDMDQTIDFLAGTLDPSLDAYAEMKRKEAEEQAQSEEDDGPEVA